MNRNLIAVIAFTSIIIVSGVGTVAKVINEHQITPTTNSNQSSTSSTSSDNHDSEGNHTGDNHDGDHHEREDDDD